MVRLKDIAEEVGLSIAVVSKVLNSSKGTSAASPQAAALIRETARRLGYVRNRTAAALKGGRHQIVGVLLHPMGAPGSEMSQAILDGVAKELTVYGYRLDLAFCYSRLEVMAALERMDSTEVDGLIVCGMPRDDWGEPLLGMAKAGMPVVTVHSRPLAAEIPNVLCDERKLLYLTTKHLIDLGCRKIAQIAYFPDRTVGYEKALAEHGIPLDEQRTYWTTRTDFDPQIGEDGVANFFFRHVEFDGLVCQADAHAVGAVRAILRTGRSIPGDVKVTGVDNSPYCRYSEVPLTSVSLSLFDRSRRAVQMVMEALDGKPLTSEEIDPQLVTRASTIGRSKTPMADAVGKADSRR